MTSNRKYMYFKYQLLEAIMIFLTVLYICQLIDSCSINLLHCSVKSWGFLNLYCFFNILIIRRKKKKKTVGKENVTRTIIVTCPAKNKLENRDCEEASVGGIIINWRTKLFFSWPTKCTYKFTNPHEFLLKKLQIHTSST